MEFRQPLTTTATVSRAEILVHYPDALGPHVTEVDPPGRAGAATLTHRIRLGDGHILPNTHLTARWRVTDPDGAVTLGPEVGLTYADTSVTWQTLAGDIVRVHWYEGGDAFGKRALEIGDKAVAEASTLLGVQETEPVDFFVYADQDTFYDALGPGTRENVGGQANAGIRTLFALITPGEIDDSWVRVVIPHEIVHLVFDTAVDNPYHFPPRWLNEGLAVYQSEGYAQTNRTAIRSAIRDGSLVPLDGLTGQFPTSRAKFFLAYAESVSAVDFLVRSHGRDALVSLIRSYADGRTDDEAFTSAIGMDTKAFNDAWFADLGAPPAVPRGPQPAPVGPLPSGWQGPAPRPSTVPVPSLQPGGPTAPIPDARSQEPLVLVVGLLVVFGLVGVFALEARRRMIRERWRP